MSKFITKSLFVTFIDNSKLAWFKVNNKQYFDWINKFDDEDFKNYLIQLGQTAEDITKEYLQNKYNSKICNISPFIKPTDDDYNKECFISDNYDLVKKVNDTTKHHIKNKSKILYQPGFIYENKFLISDFLVWNDNTKKYDLYEVKAKTSIRESKSIDGIKYSNAGKLKKDLQADISFQKYIIKKWFEDNFGENLLGDIYFVYLNKFFIKQGKIKAEDILIIDKMGEEKTIVARSENETDNGFKINTLEVKVKNNYLDNSKLENIISEIENHISLSEDEFNKKYPWDGTSWIKYFGPNVLKFLNKEKFIDKILNHEEDITKHIAYTIFGKGFKIPWNSKTKKKKVVELVNNKTCKFEDIAQDNDVFDLFSKDSKGNLTTTGKLLHSYMYCKTNNENEILQYDIADTLNGFKRYLVFYDYETISSPIPILENTRPYQQVPVQISIHIYDTKSKKINHFGLILIPGKENKLLNFNIENISEKLFLENNILVKGNYDYFMKVFIDEIKNTIGDLNNATYIVWNKAFENSVNKIAGILFSELGQDLLSINKNTFDLMEFYKNYDHFHTKSYGSYSIKYILPALSNDLSYKNLGIQKGDQAQKALENIIKGSIEKKLDDKEIINKFKQELNNLFIYCGQDSFATYLIWKYLKDKFRS